MTLETVLVETIGWIGAALLLASYALISSGRLTAKTLPYQWMNMGGATAFIINSAWNGAYPITALNVIWLGVGLTMLLKMRATRAQDKAGT